MRILNIDPVHTQNTPDIEPNIGKSGILDREIPGTGAPNTTKLCPLVKVFT